MTRVVLKKHWIVSLLLYLLVAVTPIATADTVQLTSNNKGIYRGAGAATLTQAYLNRIQANVSMNRLYARKLQGGPFEFDFGLPRQLRLRHNYWRRYNLHGSSMDLFSEHPNAAQNVSQFDRFSFDLASLSGGGKGITSADRFTSVIISTVPTATPLHGKGKPLVRDVCAGGGGNCTHSSGFSVGAHRPTAVPESGNLTILGTALLAVAGMMRRRFQ